MYDDMVNFPKLIISYFSKNIPNFKIISVFSIPKDILSLLHIFFPLPYDPHYRH